VPSYQLAHQIPRLNEGRHGGPRSHHAIPAGTRPAALTATRRALHVVPREPAYLPDPAQALEHVRPEVEAPLRIPGHCPSHEVRRQAAQQLHVWTNTADNARAPRAGQANRRPAMLEVPALERGSRRSLVDLVVNHDARIVDEVLVVAKEPRSRVAWRKPDGSWTRPDRDDAPTDTEAIEALVRLPDLFQPVNVDDDVGVGEGEHLLAILRCPGLEHESAPACL